MQHCGSSSLRCLRFINHLSLSLSLYFEWRDATRIGTTSTPRIDRTLPPPPPLVTLTASTTTTLAAASSKRREIIGETPKWFQRRDRTSSNAPPVLPCGRCRAPGSSSEVGSARGSTSEWKTTTTRRRRTAVSSAFGARPARSAASGAREKMARRRRRTDDSVEEEGEAARPGGGEDRGGGAPRRTFPG